MRGKGLWAADRGGLFGMADRLMLSRQEDDSRCREPRDELV
jgi:hypothetical protein